MNMNDTDRIEKFMNLISEIKFKLNEEEFTKLKEEIEYLLLSNLSCKEYIIKLSENINKEYFSYPLLVEKVKNIENFTMVRYQDGEWTCMLKIEPNFTNKIPKYGIEIDKLGDEMLKIIQSNPVYYVSVNAGTFHERSALVWPYIKKLKNLFVGEVFRRKSVEEGLDDFIEALSSRRVIVVGPSWFGPLKELFNHVHIVSPYMNPKNKLEFIGFKEEEMIKLEQNVSEQINIYKDENPVILYSCAASAKIMSHNFYKKYENTITQIDMGAIWDPYCGKKTRPYHEKVLNRLKK
jgi:hypothetical protein